MFFHQQISISPESANAEFCIYYCQLSTSLKSKIPSSTDLETFCEVTANKTFCQVTAHQKYMVASVFIETHIEACLKGQH